MNELKLKRMVEDAVILLDLTENQANYLDILVNFTYNLGYMDKASEIEPMLKNLKEKTIKAMEGK